MIYYNTALLSSLFDLAKQRGDEVLCNEIKRLSPVAWPWGAMEQPTDLRNKKTEKTISYKYN